MENKPPCPNHYRKRPSHPNSTFQPTYQSTNPSTSPFSQNPTPKRQRCITPPIVSSTPSQRTISSTPRQPVPSAPSQQILPSTPRRSVVSSTPRQATGSSTPRSRPRPRTQATNPAQEFAETPASTTSNFQPAFPSSPVTQPPLPTSSPGSQPPSEALSLSLSPSRPTFSKPSNAQGHGEGDGQEAGQGHEYEGVEIIEPEPIPSMGDSYCDHYGRTTTRTNYRKLEFLEEYARTGIWGQWKGI